MLEKTPYYHWQTTRKVTKIIDELTKDLQPEEYWTETFQEPIWGVSKEKWVKWFGPIDLEVESWNKNGKLDVRGVIET